MQHGLVIFDLFILSGQDSAKAIHPTVRSFDDPTMGVEVRVFTGVRLFFTGLNIWLVTTVL